MQYAVCGMQCERDFVGIADADAGAGDDEAIALALRTPHTGHRPSLTCPVW